MQGKAKCKYLRQLRQQIAEENGISLITKECTYQGACSGTCPKCEAELRELERQLAARKRLGKTVTVAAVAVGLAFSATACVPLSHELAGSVEKVEQTTESPASTDMQLLVGEVPAQTETEETQPQTEEVFTDVNGMVLTGDFAYEPLSETEAP